MTNKNSMTYWWPRIKQLDIPTPGTVIVPINMPYQHILGIVDGDEAAAKAWDLQHPPMLAAANEMGFPVFLRTDYLAAKHDWKKSCFWTDPTRIRYHISELVETTAMADLSLEAMVIREYIEMDSTFTAFSGDMPINPERRYFINKGEIQCHHHYWIEDAVLDGNCKHLLTIDDKTGEITNEERIPRGLPVNWKSLLAETNTETDEEVKLLSRYARQVIEVMPGYWSVDFCKAKDGRWILIDMAQGAASWHEESCEYAGVQ